MPTSLSFFYVKKRNKKRTPHGPTSKSVLTQSLRCQSHRFRGSHPAWTARARKDIGLVKTVNSEPLTVNCRLRRGAGLQENGVGTVLGARESSLFEPKHVALGEFRGFTAMWVA